MTHNSQATEVFCITGDVGSAVFPGWAACHARRLGIDSRFVAQSSSRLDLIVTGPPALLDAMALGCSLGPQQVMVDEVLRRPQNQQAAPITPSNLA